MLTISYFNFKYGLGLPVRLACDISNTEYKMNTMDWSSWSSVKSSAKEAPFACLPSITTESGEILSQSQAIMYYIGMKSNLMYGDDYLMNAKVLEVCLACMDVMKMLNPSMSESDPTKKKEMREILFSESYPQATERLEKHIAASSKNGFAVGDKMTLADIMVYFMHFQLQNPNLEHCKSDQVSKHPSMKKVIDNVLANPKAAATIKSLTSE